MLEASKKEIFDMALSLAVYHHSENIALPQGYVPPKLAISNAYWKTGKRGSCSDRPPGLYTRR